MPIYTYRHPDTSEEKDVVQGMSDEHIYIEDGLEWKRVYHAPAATIDTKVDPFSKKQFVEKTKNVKTYGEAWKISAEMSEGRADKTGKPDKIKEKAEKKFKNPKRGV